MHEHLGLELCGGVMGFEVGLLLRVRGLEVAVNLLVSLSVRVYNICVAMSVEPLRSVSVADEI